MSVEVIIIPAMEFRTTQPGQAGTKICQDLIRKTPGFFRDFARKKWPEAGYNLPKTDTVFGHGCVPMKSLQKSAVSFRSGRGPNPEGIQHE